MLLATRSFLSALSFCFKISMLVSAAVGSAAVWSAKADPARSMAPVRKHAISLYMGHVLSDVGEVSDAEEAKSNAVGRAVLLQFKRVSHLVRTTYVIHGPSYTCLLYTSPSPRD